MAQCSTNNNNVIKDGYKVDRHSLLQNDNHFIRPLACSTWILALATFFVLTKLLLLLPARAGRRYFKFGTAHEEFTVDSEASISKNDVSWVDQIKKARLADNAFV